MLVIVGYLVVVGSLLGGFMYILTKIRKEGMMSIERDIETSGESAVFGRHPEIAADHHLWCGR